MDILLQDMWGQAIVRIAQRILIIAYYIAKTFQILLMSAIKSRSTLPRPARLTLFAE